MSNDSRITKAYVAIITVDELGNYESIAHIMQHTTKEKVLAKQAKLEGECQRVGKHIIQSKCVSEISNFAAAARQHFGITTQTK